jgi:hypothetical protein
MRHGSEPAQERIQAMRMLRRGLAASPELRRGAVLTLLLALVAGAAGSSPRCWSSSSSTTISAAARFSGLRGPAGELRGRRRECDVLDRLLDAVRAGESRALVVWGEPGVGKTALLEYLVEHASGCRVVRATGVQSELELTFAGLHQLCAPMLDRRLQRLRTLVVLCQVCV